MRGWARQKAPPGPYRLASAAVTPRPMNDVPVNQLIGLIKATSLVFYVSLLDLFGQVESMGSTYPGDIIPLLMVATVWYLIMTTILSVIQFYVERAYSKGALRTVPPTPLQRLKSSFSEGLASRGQAA